MFLDRLIPYANYLKSKINPQNNIFPSEFKNFVPLDFINCHEKLINNSIEGCLWGTDNVCFVCDSNYFLKEYNCSRCQSDISSVLISNNQILDQCNTSANEVVKISNKSDLNTSMILENPVFFIDNTLVSSGENLGKYLLTEKIPYLNSIVDGQYDQSNFELTSNAVTYKLDFSDTSILNSDFPLDMLIMQVTIFLNKDSKKEIIWKHLFPDIIEHPFVIFSTSKFVIPRYP
jgi:hypothetical protein